MRPADTLGLGEQEMRRLGHLMVDLVVDHLAGRAGEAAISVAHRAALETEIGGPLPEGPGDAEAALRTLHEHVLPHMQHGDHPRYFARVPGPSSFAGILGDWLATGFNAIASSWVGGSGPATVELVVLEWMRHMLGLPPGTEGVIVSGGSLANFTAFAAAVAEKGRGTVYLNDQAHSSLKRNLTSLGIRPEEIRVLPATARQCFDMDQLASTIAADRKAGLKTSMVIANAGTTNTGAADPLHAVADLCEREDIWMHVDGAYGAPAAFTEKGRVHLAGMERAHSLVLDPHKWLFQPYDCGCVFVSRPGALERAFAMYPEYLKDVMAREDEVDLFNRSLELTRRGRALKLWMTFRTYGTRRIVEAIDHGIALAEVAQALIEADPAWELVTPAQIGIVTFALRGGDAARHAEMVGDITRSGFATLTSTVVGGRSVLRLCTLNPLTTREDIEQTLARLLTGHG